MSHKPINDEVRMDICRELGQYKRPIEIQRELKERGISVQLTSISYYEKKPEWRNVVEKFRREYLSAIMSVPISQKRHRLQKLDDYLYHLESGDKRITCDDDKDKFNRMMKVLDQARLEMEPSKHDTYNISLMTQFNSLTDDEIRDRKTQLMEKVLKIQKAMEETKDASDREGIKDSTQHDEAVRSEEGEAGVLRQSEQGSDNGAAQGKVPDEKV